MKKWWILFTLIVIFLGCSSVSAQDKEPLDTIVRLGGSKLPCQIMQVSSSKVTYQLPGEDEGKEMERKKIQKILYKTGREEEFNKPVLQSIDKTDWRSVIITEDPSEVAGLVEKGKVESSSWEGSKNRSTAARTAEIKLKKRAVAMGGTIVLLTKKDVQGGFGEVPTYELKGKVYGW